MFNHSKMILDPLVSDVGYDKEKPEMDDGRSSLRWWISQRMTLKSTVSPLTSSLSGRGCRQIAASGRQKVSEKEPRVRVCTDIDFALGKACSLGLLLGLFFQDGGHPRACRRNSFDNKRGGGTTIRKRCLRNLDGNVSYCGSDSKNGKTLCIVCIDTMTMRTLCRAQICLRVCVCVCVEAEFMRRNCDSATVDVIRVSLFRVLRCAFFSFFI